MNTINIDNNNNINININNKNNLCHIRKLPWSHRSDIIIRMAEIEDNYNIMEIYCIDGFDMIYLCQKYPNMKGTIIVENMTYYNIVYENIKKNNLKERIQVVILDINLLDNMKFNNIKFDRILFLESINYSNNIPMLLNITILLKQNGKIFIKTHILKNDYSIFNYIKKNNYKNIKYNIYESYKFLFHYNIFDYINLIKKIFHNNIEIYYN
jgi:hypothetical protein